MDYLQYAVKKLGGIAGVRRDYVKTQCTKKTRLETLTASGLGDMTIGELMAAMKPDRRRRSPEQNENLRVMVLQYLQRVGSPMPAREVAEDLGEDMRQVSRALATLATLGNVIKVGDRFDAKWVAK